MMHILHTLTNTELRQMVDDAKKKVPFLRIVETPEPVEDNICPDCKLPFGIEDGDCSCPVEFEIWE